MVVSGAGSPTRGATGDGGAVSNRRRVETAGGVVGMWRRQRACCITTGHGSGGGIVPVELSPALLPLHNEIT